MFKGKKVGLFAGQTTDQTELHVVAASLHTLHVPVAGGRRGRRTAPTGDQAATYQQAGIIAQRFLSAGVNEVVTVGTGSLVWPEALAANQEL